MTPWRLAHLENVRAGCLTRAKRYPEAEPLVASSMPVLLKKWPPDTLYGHDALQRSIQLYQATGSQAKLAHYRLLAENKDAAGPPTGKPRDAPRRTGRAGPGPDRPSSSLPLNPVPPAPI